MPRAEAALNPNHHALHYDDGVVDQHAHGDHQRAEGNTLQLDIVNGHHHERAHDRQQ